MEKAEVFLMKMNFVRPKEEPKEYHFEPQNVCVRKSDAWNSFSVTPQAGEKYGHYSFKKSVQGNNGK